MTCILEILHVHSFRWVKILFLLKNGIKKLFFSNSVCFVLKQLSDN